MDPLDDWISFRGHVQVPWNSMSKIKGRYIDSSVSLRNTKKLLKAVQMPTKSFFCVLAIAASHDFQLILQTSFDV